MVQSSHVTLEMVTQAAFTCTLDTQLSIPGATSDLKCLYWYNYSLRTDRLVMINMSILMWTRESCYF